MVSCPGVEPVSSDAPVVTGAVMMNQSWRELTLLYSAVDPEQVADRMPPGVRPDTLDGVTYVGADSVPYTIRGNSGADDVWISFGRD
jgi:uncharacterized protein